MKFVHVYVLKVQADSSGELNVKHQQQQLSIDRTHRAQITCCRVCCVQQRGCKRMRAHISLPTRSFGISQKTICFSILHQLWCDFCVRTQMEMIKYSIQIYILIYIHYMYIYIHCEAIVLCLAIMSLSLSISASPSVCVFFRHSQFLPVKWAKLSMTKLLIE